ncbi:MAG: glycosyltransferase family 9 protein [Mobilitalea sp.]
MMKLTKRFIVLDNFIFDPKDFKNTYISYVNSVTELETKLEDLLINRSEETKSLQENVLQLEAEPINGVFFSVSEITDDKLKFFEHFTLFDQLPRSFYVSDIILEDHSVAIAYTNKKRAVEFMIETKEKPVCVFLGYGIGDFFITSSFWYELVNKYKKITIILGKNLISKDIFLTLFGDKCEIYEVQDYMVLEKMYKMFVDSGKFSKCYNVLFTIYKRADIFQHYYHMFADQLYDIEVDDAYKCIGDVHDKFTGLLTVEEKNTISLIKNRTTLKIGIQFYTDGPHNWRCWGAENVQRFIELCIANNLDPYILTPYPKDKYELTSITDVSNLSIYSIACLIPELDYVVGIDSCCGHIASAFNIPTVTLWSRQDPVYLDYDHIKLSFRPLRNNYSLVPKSNDINEISGDQAFSILMDCIKGNIQLNKEITSLFGIFNAENTGFI